MNGARVHPRACGGSRRREELAAKVAGTSPRVRGKPTSPARPPARSRYIPARAGEAERSACRRRRLQVHPRACGGSLDPFGDDGSRDGTSPRVRGKRCLTPGIRPTLRYIPARAGEALLSVGNRQLFGVHPRACGGSWYLVRANPCAPGTSPRVRGKPGPGDRVRGCRGYILARAGEARGRGRRRRPHEVHPRACGGSPSWLLPSAPGYGTSPRVRGKHDDSPVAAQYSGYIPARAGEASPGLPRP